MEVSKLKVLLLSNHTECHKYDDQLMVTLAAGFVRRKLPTIVEVYINFQEDIQEEGDEEEEEEEDDEWDDDATEDS